MLLFENEVPDHLAEEANQPATECAAEITVVDGHMSRTDEEISGDLQSVRRIRKRATIERDVLFQSDPRSPRKRTRQSGLRSGLPTRIVDISLMWGVQHIDAVNRAGHRLLSRTDRRSGMENLPPSHIRPAPPVFRPSIVTF